MNESSSILPSAHHPALFLIKEKIMNIPSTQSLGTGSNEIPKWIKNNAKWWADGKIDDDSFIQGIQFLIKEGIINP